MRLPTAPEKYTAGDQASMRRALEQADMKNRKTDQDIDLSNATRVILTSPDGTRYAITVANGGALGTTAA